MRVRPPPRPPYQKRLYYWGFCDFLPRQHGPLQHGSNCTKLHQNAAKCAWQVDTQVDTFPIPQLPLVWVSSGKVGNDAIAPPKSVKFRCVYRAVMAGVAWRMRRCAVCMFTPLWATSVQKECRRQWTSNVLPWLSCFNIFPSLSRFANPAKTRSASNTFTMVSCGMSNNVTLSNAPGNVLQAPARRFFFSAMYSPNNAAKPLGMALSPLFGSFHPPLSRRYRGWGNHISLGKLDAP